MRAIFAKAYLSIVRLLTYDPAPALTEDASAPLVTQAKSSCQRCGTSGEPMRITNLPGGLQMRAETIGWRVKPMRLGQALAALVAPLVLVATACTPEAQDTPGSEGIAPSGLSTSGLVVAYAFDEGTGTSAADASGNGHTGTLLNGAGWVAGHSGSSVNLDGTNDTVSAGNLTDLNGLSAVTVSAWVKGSVGTGSPDAIIVAKDAAFALVVGSPAHKAAFGVKSGSTWYGLVSSTSSVDDGAYHFLSGVYDGTSLKIFVDGVQQRTQSVGAHVLNSPSTALLIGSCTGGPDCSKSGEMWRGSVDDVRVYNRALSQTEIQTDRDNPVSMAPPDTTPPSTPTNVSGVAASSTQINLTWTASTDNVGITGYRVLRNGSQVGTSATTSFSDVGLTASTMYTYTVTAVDAAMNVSAASTAISVTTQAQADTTPPTVPGGVSGTATSSSQINLSWTASTDDVGVTGYKVFRNGSLVGSPSGTSFSDTGLSASTSYSYTVAAVDAASNTSAPSTPINVTTQASGAAGQVTLASDNFNRPDGPLGPNWTVIDSNPVIHNQHIEETNATDGWDSIAIYTAMTWPDNQYSQVRVLAANEHGGAAPIVRALNTDVIEMYTLFVTGPLGTGAKLTLAKFITHIYTEIWSSTVTVNAGDLLYLSANGSTLTVKLNGNTVTTQVDTSLTHGYAGFDLTNYVENPVGAMGDGQLDDWEAGAIGGVPPPTNDTTPPSVPTNLAGSADSSNRVNLTWTASTDDVGVAGYDVFRNGSQVGTSTTTSFTDSSIVASTTYSYTVRAFDPSGNKSAFSTAVNVTTNGVPPASPVVAFDFNEGMGLTANDSSGNSYQGTLVNGPTWTSGHTGSGLLFDGVNDYLSAGNIAALNGVHALTVSAWIKGAVGAGSADGVLVGKDAAFALAVGINVPHKAQFAVKSGNNWFGFPASTTSVDDGSFHYVTGVYDGSAMKVYVDGNLENSQNVGALTLGAPSTALQVASCAGGPNCDASGEMWQGTVDDVRVYNVALTAAQIVTDMNTPVP
jgi:chitodextrinase